MVKYLCFHKFFFCLNILFNVNGKATVWRTPCFSEAACHCVRFVFSIWMPVSTTTSNVTQLWSSPICLVCFFVYHIEISQTQVSLVALLVPLKSSQAVGGALNWTGFTMFRRTTVQELFNIELFFHWVFDKMNTKSSREIRVCSWYWWKAHNEWDFVEMIL